MASVAKREDTGKWVARYVDSTGSHRSKSFTLKKDAESYARKVQTELERGEHVAPAEQKTVAYVAELYMEDLRTCAEDGLIRPERSAQVCRMLRLHVVAPIGGNQLADLTPAVLEPWIAGVRRTGHRRTGGRLSASSMTQILIAFKGLEDFALRRNYVPKRFLPEARLDAARGEKRRIRTFAVEELTAVLKASTRGRRGVTARDTLFMRCYVHLAAFCGLRIGEINALKPEHLDLDKRVIQVRHNLTRLGELRGPKTRAGVRDVPMPTVVADLFRTWVSEFYLPNPLGLVFTTSTGGFPKHNGTNRMWLRLLKAAGLDGGETFHFHALRHFAGSA